MIDAASAAILTHPTPLHQALAEAQWGARDLARAVNKWLTTHGRASDRIDLSAPYPWIRLGYCPHGPVPEIVARVLTERLGRYVGAEELWPGHTRTENTHRQAPISENGTLDEVLRLLDHLANGGRPPTLGRTDLAVAVVSALRDPIEPPHPAGGARDRVHAAQAAVVADHVAALRTLDDSQGGGAVSLRYVTRELSSVLDLTRCGGADPGVRDVLLTCVADLAQIGGWMWFDTGAADVAIHFLRLSVAVARAAHDHDRAANAAAMVAYIAAEANAPTAAVTIANAACQTPSTSRLLASRLQGRRATAAAANRDLDTFRRATDRAQELLATAPRDHTQPFLYYLSEDQLAAEAGYSLVSLAARTTLGQTPLLRQARELLEPRAQFAGNPSYQRSAVLHGCQLTRVHLMLHDLDGAVAAARTVVALLPQVQSGRCTGMLRSVRTELRKRRRSRTVADFLPELESVLQSE